MKQAQITHKVPGGKLFRIELGYDRHIETVKITGDFFLHPEETILELEECLRGVPLPAQAEELAARLEAVLARNAALLVGVSPADLASAMLEVLV
jgi:lipoate---protein ligase